ncbi:hypothetical protein [Streptomyces sp. TRM49041]|uniref:hypothetical protein n=1 Tax=Streptomyces sp. TRM49041 TaxID=2603216 RepID=UPI0011ED4381|nr:hypothetical protein [Streptomyces sp. TRM49041]
MRTKATALAVCATLLGLALAGCATENADPRAYAGTDSGETLDEILERYRLTLPSCEVEDLRFTGKAKELGMNLRLRFEAPEDCVNAYLDKYGVDRERALRWPFPASTVNGKEFSPTRPPFPDNAMKTFSELKLDPKKTYDFHHRFKTPTKATFDVLVVPEGGEQRAVYLVSTYNGNI